MPWKQNLVPEILTPTTSTSNFSILHEKLAQITKCKQLLFKHNSSLNETLEMKMHKQIFA